MSSVIEGYSYDIFISYRQKDNKYDGWVTDFAGNLKKELEATFKEEISVYFDINPHDGLLETYDVGASLREKLKCLIFIPVMSRTYCDPGSFAWKYELKAFIELASKDKLGMKVLLGNGNVANRVLPVRIHELDSIDLKLCEQTLDGVLRPVDFIYKSAGVNRPLRSNEDHPQDNLNKIYYRDQINKVANAIDEIIRSLKMIQYPDLGSEWSLKEPDLHGNNNGILEITDLQLPAKQNRKIQKVFAEKITVFQAYWHNNVRRCSFSILFVSAMIVLALIWNGHFKLPGIGNSKREQAKQHVKNAVKYFNDNYYGPAKSELDLALSFDPEYSYAWSTLAAVNVKLGNLDEAILQTVEAVKFDPANPTAAYNLAYALEDKRDFHQAAEWYSKALKIDSTLVPAYSALGRLYNMLHQPVDALLILNLAKDKYPQSEHIWAIYKNLGNSYLIMNQPDEAIRWLDHSVELNPSEPETNLFLAKAYEASGKMAMSIDLWEKYIEIETDTAKISDAKQHLKEMTIKHLQEIMK